MKKSLSISKTKIPGSPSKLTPVKASKMDLRLNLKSSRSTGKPGTSTKLKPTMSTFDLKRSTIQEPKASRPKSKRGGHSKNKTSVSINLPILRSTFQSPKKTTMTTTHGQLRTRANCNKTEQPGNRSGLKSTKAS